MNSLPINWSGPAPLRLLGGTMPFASLLLVSLVLANGTLIGGAALAQQYSADQTTGQPTGPTTGQVDLLATVQDNVSESPDQPAPTISSIDEAVMAISGDTDNATATAAEMNDNAGTPDNMTGAAALTLTRTPAADNATDSADPASAATLTTTSTTTTSTTSTSPAATLSSGGVSLEKADAPRFGVADIGIDPAIGDGSGLTATIWRGTSADRATMLLKNDAVIGSSPALSSLASDVVARRAVRPDGPSEGDQTLISGRLDWLAAAGRSEDLAQMIAQLPNEAPWLAWKQWLVETQLMSRRDADACRNVMYQAGRTFEAFWHKAKVICTAVHTGDIAGAQFAADILLAMGVDDPVFAGLVGKLLNGTDPGPIDPALVDQLHIVLMEAAHHDIGISDLAALPGSSIQTAVGLRYLDPDARLVATWRALGHGLIDHERAAKLWRSAAVETDLPQLALARHQSQPSALTRALVWRALDADKSAGRLPFIAAAMDVDIADGAGWMMAPLYAELGLEALAFNGAETQLAADDGALRAKLAMLIAVGDSTDMPADLSDGEASAARDLLDMAQTGRVDMTSLAILGKYSLLPLVASDNGAVAMEPGEAMSWLASASPDAIQTETFLSTSPIIMQALDDAAAAGRVAETILLAHRAVGEHSLAEMNPADVARIAAALEAVGQQQTARQFRREAVAAHLLAMAHAQTITLPPVVSAAPLQQPTPDNSMPSAVAESDAAQDGGTPGNNEPGDNEPGALTRASGTVATQQADGDSTL